MKVSKNQGKTPFLTVSIISSRHWSYQLKCLYRLQTSLRYLWQGQLSCLYHFPVMTLKNARRILLIASFKNSPWQMGLILLLKRKTGGTDLFSFLNLSRLLETCQMTSLKLWKSRILKRHRKTSCMTYSYFCFSFGNWIWLLHCCKTRHFYNTFCIHVIWSFIFVICVIFLLYVLLYIYHICFF